MKKYNKKAKERSLPLILHLLLLKSEFYSLIGVPKFAALRQ